MTKIKYLFAFVVFAVIAYACDDNLNGFTNPYENVDYEALAISDNDSIVAFLSSHFYNESLDSLQLIDANQTSILEDSRLKIIETEQNSIDHKLYVFVTEVGVTTPDKGNPTEMDSIFVNRTGLQLINNSLDTDPFDQGDETWWSLATTFGIPGMASTPIRGWTKGFPKLKPGENITNNGPLMFQNTGKGFIFIPSGLAYSSINYQLGGPDNPLFDKIIVFKVELLDFVKDTDHDNDGIPSIEEDANGDGDPTNDFSDSSEPNLPDYLNPKY